MGKYLITGRQGSGKTTLIRALQDRSFTAYNTDDIPDSTKLQDKITGETIKWPEGPVDWTRYAWNWQEGKINELLSSDEHVFIGAIVSNQYDFYDKFDRIFVLTVNKENIKNRLMEHEHESHHLPGEIDRILESHKKEQSKLLEGKAEQVDANTSPGMVMDDILSKINLASH